MTTDQMVLECKLASDNLDSSTIPNMANEEWLYYLNVAQEEFIKTRYSRNNMYSAGVQEIQKRTDDLNKITRSYYVYAYLIGDNVYQIDYSSLFRNEALSNFTSDKYMFYLRGNIKANKTNCPSKYVPIKIETLDKLDVVFKDPFKKPNPSKAIGYFENNTLYVKYAPGYTIELGKITCIKYPKPISNDVLYAPVSDCELSDHTHREIVEMAVRLAVGDLKPEKLEVKTIQSKQVE